MCGGAFCVAMAQTDKQNAGDPVLPAPKANNGVNFARGVSTQGGAVNSASLGAIPGGDGCSPLNPCAVATPALDTVNGKTVLAPLRSVAQDVRDNTRATADAQPSSGAVADQGSAATRCGPRGANAFGQGGGQGNGQGNGQGRRGGGANAFGQGGGQGFGQDNGQGRRGGGANVPGQGGGQGFGQGNGQGRRGGGANASGQGGGQGFGQGNGQGRRGGGANAPGQGGGQGFGQGNGRRGGGAFTPGQGGQRGGSDPCPPTRGAGAPAPTSRAPGKSPSKN